MSSDCECNDEPDFTRPVESELSAQSGQAPTEQARQKSNEMVVLPRKYTSEDLNPTQKDSSCKPNWPLAAFWPVYVGNFKVEEWKEETWYEQVSNYFAHYGLLTRMIFFHRNQTCLTFARYQKNCHLVDMLVYFTSKEDAERAIETCHHDSYYGYNLNVLPGRTPVYCDNTRSVRFVELAYHYPVEWRMEDSLSQYVPLTFVARHPEQDVLVEFGTTEAMLAGIGSQMKWKPILLKEPTKKQRFLEEDVTMHIEFEMESNPSFMNQQPTPTVLGQLYEGARPKMITAWEGHIKFVKAPLFKINRKKETARKRVLAERSRNRAKMRRTEVVSRDAPRPAPDTSREQSRRQKEADNIQAINWILRQHGAGPISKTSVRDFNQN